MKTITNINEKFFFFVFVHIALSSSSVWSLAHFVLIHVCNNYKSVRNWFELKYEEYDQSTGSKAKKSVKCLSAYK